MNNGTEYVLQRETPAPIKPADQAGEPVRQNDENEHLRQEIPRLRKENEKLRQQLRSIQKLTGVQP